MFDDTTEVAMLCTCDHPALTHMHAMTDGEWCNAPGCLCVEFVPQFTNLPDLHPEANGASINGVPFTRAEYEALRQRSTNMAKSTEVRVRETFQRRHANGWIATVDATPDGFFAASAHEVGAVTVQWVKQRIPDLPTAQQKADAVVPLHDCTCGGWVATHIV